MPKITEKNILRTFLSLFTVVLILSSLVFTNAFQLETYGKITVTVKSPKTSSAVKKQAPVVAKPVISRPITNMTVTGYYALGSWNSLFGKNYPYTSNMHSTQISTLAFAWYCVNDKGALLDNNNYSGWKKPDGYKELLKAAKQYKFKTEMVVNTAAGTNEAKILDNSASWNQSVANIVYEAKQYGGVNLDFENIQSSYKNKYTNYVKLLYSKLKQANLKLTLSLQPPNSTYKGFDYLQLGKFCDKAIIMAHDYWKLPHQFPKPEPMDKVTEAIILSKKYIPSSKLVLGISVASETSKSIIQKIDLAKEYGLSGISLWYLGKINNDMWSSLKSTIIAVK